MCNAISDELFNTSTFSNIYFLTNTKIRPDLPLAPFLFKGGRLITFAICTSYSSNFVSWFIVKNIVFYPILFGAIYIPPESSKYSDIDFFDVIQEDILKYNAGKDYKICLLGDYLQLASSDFDTIVIIYYHNY
jgi:hypothetical protein